MQRVIRHPPSPTPAAANNTDSYAFTAQQIGSFKAGGSSFPLTVGPNNDNHKVINPASPNVLIDEV